MNKEALAIGVAIVIFVAFLTLLARIVSPEEKAKIPLGALYLNQEKVIEKILPKIQALKKIKYCTKERYGACISEPFELKENESLGLVSYRLAIVNDDSSYKILPSPYELLAGRWYCCDDDGCYEQIHCHEPPCPGDIGFMTGSEYGRWRLFLPDGSIKIADRKAEIVFYVPIKYNFFEGAFDDVGFFEWVTGYYGWKILDICNEKDIKKHCNFLESLYFFSIEKSEKLPPETIEKIINYAVENLPDAFLLPYKKTFFRIEGTQEYVAGHSLLKVEKIS